jgi:hypothetical protein
MFGRGRITCARFLHHPRQHRLTVHIADGETMNLHDEVKTALRASITGLAIVATVCVVIGTTVSEWPGADVTWPLADNAAAVALEAMSSDDSADTRVVARSMRVGYASFFGGVKAHRISDPLGQD